MTIHQSKGLEFPYVYIVGLENGLFPSHRNMREKRMIEEERRLFYVAITRAIKKVVLSYAIRRFQFGAINNTEKSLFIDEINFFFIQKINRNHLEQRDVNNFIKTPKLDNRKLRKIKENTNTKYHRKGLKIGQNIMHNIFGKGEIKKIDEDSGNQKITVLFTKGGEKILLTKFAKFDILT